MPIVKMFQVRSCLLLLLVVVTVPSQAQFGDSISAASLGGAPVGVYDKKTYPIDSLPIHGSYFPFLPNPYMPFFPQDSGSDFDDSVRQGRRPRCNRNFDRRQCRLCGRGLRCNAIRLGRRCSTNCVSGRG